MKSTNLSNYRDGVRDGIPIALGYLAVAFTLGIAARNFRIGAFPATLMSLLNFTSAGEFAALGIISAGAPYPVSYTHLIFKETLWPTMLLVISAALVSLVFISSTKQPFLNTATRSEMLSTSCLSLIHIW